MQASFEAHQKAEAEKGYKLQEEAKEEKS